MGTVRNNKYFDEKKEAQVYFCKRVSQKIVSKRAKIIFDICPLKYQVPKMHKNMKIVDRHL